MESTTQFQKNCGRTTINNYPVHTLGRAIVNVLKPVAIRRRFTILRRYLPLTRTAPQALSGNFIRSLYEDLLEFSICSLDQGAIRDQAMGILFDQNKAIDFSFLSEALYRWPDLKTEFLALQALERYGKWGSQPLRGGKPVLKLFALLGTLFGSQVENCLREYYRQVEDGFSFFQDPPIKPTANILVFKRIRLRQSDWTLRQIFYSTTPTDKDKSALIDRLLEEDGKRFKRQCTILLFGSDRSDRSKYIKQMKIVHQNGYTQEELAAFRPPILRNVLHAAQNIISACLRLNLSPLSSSNRVLADMIMEYRLEDENGDSVLNSEIAEAIHVLMQDETILGIMRDHSEQVNLGNNAPYFLANVLRIGMPEYLPTASDVLRADPEDSQQGIVETRFSMGQLSLNMVDVGQRSERRKWIHCFESVTSIIYFASLDKYITLEGCSSGEPQTNPLVESLVLFESIVNSGWFLRTSIILFLMNTDALKAKLPHVPLERYFPEYIGGNDINKAARYILWRFMQANRARLSVYPHLTQETDTSNLKLVFAAAKETILQNSLKDSGIL